MSYQTPSTSAASLRLFRGLRIPRDGADQAIDVLRQNGHDPTKARRSIFQRLVPNPKALLERKGITNADTRGPQTIEAPAICACGDEAGASHYAWRDPSPDIPVLMEIRVPIDRLAVDGNDFLFTIFSHGDPKKARPVVQRAFGAAALTYAERAWATPKGDEARIALCDLAVLDPDVILHHHANQFALLGRYGTAFSSAFSIRLPILTGEVVRVWQPLKPMQPALGGIRFQELLI